ncbi:ATP-dependent nuclease [Nesterenkonia halotolerans]|uniref:ABC-type cobalamin/Fe3+-siderophores transport system ATPase subunit n=1 Tax=Nesterenkonia halotolerans TaxID=225325 RepID=A0ABR9J3Z5_9MICC|nr:AAA family ATPase [Nesterenkonia halotolerans]MBE1513724.1 ABC-type cobalamin/Fe3+-siderophores transport system ATPase subunit [Nesterenkonia halotolerans]
MDTWIDQFLAAFPDRTDVADADSTAFDFSIDRINMAGGESVPIQRAGVTAIVGSNNAGKSTLLREISELISHRRGSAERPRVAVESLNVTRRGTTADAISWLGQNASFVVQDHQSGFHRAETGILDPATIQYNWTHSSAGLGGLAGSVVFYGDAQRRFNIGGAAEMRDSHTDPPEHPIHYLQDSKELLENVSAISQQIFGKPLTLDTLGRTIRLRVGETEMEPPRIDDISAEYRERVAALHPLDAQGDGMRSLMGQLLPIITAAYKIVIIDEPEAFLHPPQAHALGAELGRIAVSTGLQIIVATHDRSFLTGLLDSGVDVSVVRLTRGDGPARGSRLDSNQLRDLWADPVLKYTNVLDGLFHRLVVVAEAEGDCAYLAAAVETGEPREDSVPRNEILFVPTGGKDGMAKVAAALTAVNVPVVVAPDLDMLADVSKLKALVESLGAEWTTEMSDAWRLATVNLNTSREPATVNDVLVSIESALHESRGEKFSAEHKKTISALSRTKDSPWSAVKEHGMSAFKGESYTAAQKLLALLDEAGVVLVREGELEGLAPEVTARKGLPWLQAALTDGQQSNQVTQAHVKRILKSGVFKIRSIVNRAA